MFRRYPYRGWLFISIALWLITGFLYYQKAREMKPTRMATAIAKDLRQKEESLGKLLEDQDLMRRMFTESLSEKDVEELTSLSYHIYAYDSGAIVFWNTNEILVDCNYPRSNAPVSLLTNDKGSFVKKCVSLSYLTGRKRLTVLFPIVTRYPFENNYLRSHFEAGSYIPVSTEVTDKPREKSYGIKDISGKNAFFLSFNEHDPPVWEPGKIIIALTIAALLLSILWLQLITVYLTRKQSPTKGFLLTLGIVVGLRTLTYIFGLPFNIGSLPVFSPQLYASSSFLPSLGDLLLNALCFLWIVVFVLRHVNYNFLKETSVSEPIKKVLAAIWIASLIWYCFAFINLIGSLVLDSRISFDVSHFYSISSFTILGLVTIGMLTGVSCLVLYILNVQLSSLISNKWVKYTCVLVIGTLIIVLTKQHQSQKLYLLFLAWIVLFLALLDIQKLTFVSDFFAPQMLFWAFFVCTFCTGTLQYFNYVKERETRKRFAEQIVKQRDYVTEYAFKNVSQSIQQDAVIKNFLANPTQEQRRLINERFDALYLGGQMNKYQAKVLLFDTLKRPLYNVDTQSFATLNNLLSTSDFTMDMTLFYREDALDGRYYMAGIPIQTSDTVADTLGYVYIDFAIKESFGESVYPELLQPGTVKSNQNEEGYSYGVYVNNKLITQASEYGLPTYWETDSLKSQHTFFNWESSSELFYKAGPSKTVVVIRYNKLWLETITLFSYLFGIQILIVLSIVFYRLCLSYYTKPKANSKFINLTLRNRIHFSMLGIVLISFFILGVITITFFTYQYKQSNRKKLQIAMQSVARSTVLFLKQQENLVTQETFNSEVTNPKFKYFISGLANSQKVDINVYNASGILNVSSQENIYDKFLLARIIRPDAYYALNNMDTTLVIQDERIGRLSYLSCYLPIKADNGQSVGYINVPFFSSEKELNFQISNFLVALINIYAFIFLVSSVLTVFITRWLTRTLSIVINRFERLSLTQNELIDWPYDDEIGLLVKEYNKMVKKVEENAILMAQNEREMAWREMARQVAHEIKNPLTPMKLNIQYLQQALRSGYSNIEELAAKVTESLIEQIDNLSYIASEFSNFAKMPEAKPEEVDLNELLERAAELYLNETDVKVTLKKSQERVVVVTDKSQLLRTFTNLLENAVQSIPEGRAGKINVVILREDGHAVVSVSDNGRGIAPDIAEKIFQPYFTTKSSGTGLGLAMTRKIIEFWKGSIWFETEEGVGTTFYIRLPLQ
jgi:two-component system, NtrC family, nitrogen regulation sensor histidine kinase NtrY